MISGDTKSGMILSSVLFLLYMVYYYFDFIEYVSTKNNINLTYLYLSGYGKWIFKIILSLFTLFILILTIATVIIAVKTMFSYELQQVINQKREILGSGDAEQVIQSKNRNIYLYYANLIDNYTIRIKLMKKFVVIFLIT